jgi:phosphatidate cytidylyltransferase
MKQRAITGLIFAAAMLGGIYGGKYTFYILFGLVAAGSLWELGAMVFSDTNYRRARQAVMVGLGLLPYLSVGWQFLHREGSSPAFSPEGWFILILLALFLLFIVELYLSAERPFSNIGHYALGLAYTGIPYTLLVGIAMWSGEYSPHRVFGLIWLIWTNDVMAYVTGSRLGRRKLFPRISPGKTWEGMVGGLVATLLMAWLLSYWLPDYTPGQWLLLGAIASVIGTFGDLVESMLKRSVGVKDSGTLFPGHGGFLDRFDAFVFCLPFVWAALWVLGSGF